MVKCRRRFKQTTTLAQRLTYEANRLRERATRLSPGPEQAELWHKVHQTEAALRIDAWLAAPGTPPPADAMSLMGKAQKKRSLAKHGGPEAE
jgi:hypothetical protein